MIYKINIQRILLWLTFITFFAVFLFIKPIAQDDTYHHFANDYCLLQISNFWNVVSNIGFVILGFLGFKLILINKIKNPIIWTLFAGIFLTGFGSAYYHYNPNNATLV